MFLKERSSGDLVEVLKLQDLFDPHAATLSGRYHHGEELQEPEAFRKDALVFPSGESLPKCWLDPHYKEKQA